MTDEQNAFNDLRKDFKELTTHVHFQFKQMRFDISSLKHEIRCLRLNPQEARCASRERLSQHFEGSRLKREQEDEDRLCKLIEKTRNSICNQ